MFLRSVVAMILWYSENVPERHVFFLLTPGVSELIRPRARTTDRQMRPERH